MWQLLMKLLNPFMKFLLRSRLHSLVSGRYMLIRVTGRKSGRVYTTPVEYHRAGGTVLVISSRKYTWWKNLRGGTAVVQMRIRGEEYTGHAETFLDEANIASTFRTIYPRATPEQVARFTPGAVAIRIQLETLKEHIPDES